MSKALELRKVIKLLARFGIIYATPPKGKMRRCPGFFRKPEAKLLKLNCDKAHAELPWHSVLTIDECLQMTATWYKKFYEAKPQESMYEICTQQIAEYGERAKR